MNRITKGTIYIVLIILAVAIAILFGGLVFWGLGILVIKLFNIDFNWTFYHGLGMEILGIGIRMIFKD